MSRILRNLLLVVGLVVSGAAAAEVTFFQGEGFSGGSFTADRTIWNFANQGFNDKAESAIVRGGPWQVCVDAQFHGRCVVLQPGEYGSLRRFGMNDKISSTRPVGDQYGVYQGPRGDYYARNYGPR